MSVTSASRIALLGMGGVGKSVLAALVARDYTVRRTFRDGIIWVELHPNPNLLYALRQIGAAVHDDVLSYTSVPIGRLRLAETLQTKECLLILDDVWSQRDVEPFLRVLNARSGLIITTRNMGVAQGLAAEICQVDLFTEAQSLELLSKWSGQTIDHLPLEAREVASECGNLPLALAMIGAVVGRESRRWAGVLEKLQNADLTKIHNTFPEYPYPNLMLAIEVSVQDLPDQVRDRYLDLAVFPEQVPIPEAVFETFWAPMGWTQYDVQDALQEFVGRSLARRDDQGLVTLHDLQKDYLVGKTSHRNLVQLHKRLLEAYRKRARGGWHHGPNDGYYFQSLAFHLKAAGRKNELRDLLLDFDWLRAKLVATDVALLIADFDLLQSRPEQKRTERSIRQIGVPPWRLASRHLAQRDTRGRETTSVVRDDALRLVKGALELSSHVLAFDKTQLPAQLVGRLSGLPLDAIMSFCGCVRSRVRGHWLRPLGAALGSPGGPLERTLAGHDDSVQAVAMIPDGTRAISGSIDRTLKVWDLETGKEIFTLVGHNGGVNAVVVTPNGQFAISGSHDRTLKMWELEGGHEVLTLRGHTAPVTAVAVTAWNDFVIAGAEDGSFRVWKIPEGREIATFKGNASSVRAIAILPNGKYALSASDDRTLRIWDLPYGRDGQVLNGQAGVILGLTVTPNGRFAVSAGENLTKWDLNKREPIGKFVGHRLGSWAVAVTPEGRYLVSCSMDRSVMIWSFGSRKLVRILLGHVDMIFGLAISPDGRKIVSCSQDKTLRVWNLDRKSSSGSSSRHRGVVTSIAVTPDGRHLVSSSSDKTIKIWDCETGRDIATLTGHSDDVNAIAVTPDNSYVLSASDDGSIKIWSMPTGSEVQTFAAESGKIKLLAITTDGRQAVAASAAAGAIVVITLWDLVSGRKLAEQTYEPKAVSDLWMPHTIALTSDGKYVIFGSYTGGFQVWHLRAANFGCAFECATDPVGSMAVLPHGNRVACGMPGRVEIWDLVRRHRVRTFQRSNKSSTYVSISPDGRHLVTAGWGRVLEVCNYASGRVIARFTAEDDYSCCAISNDVGTIVAGDWSGFVHVLRLEGLPTNNAKQTQVHRAS